MTQNKQKNTTKKSTENVAKKSHRKPVTARATKVCDCAAQQQQLQQTKDRLALMATGEDVRNSILIVSLVINLYFLIAWIMLQVTTHYDVAVIQLLLNR